MVGKKWIYVQFGRDVSNHLITDQTKSIDVLREILPNDEIKSHVLRIGDTGKELKPERRLMSEVETDNKLSVVRKNDQPALESESVDVGSENTQIRQNTKLSLLEAIFGLLIICIFLIGLLSFIAYHLPFEKIIFVFLMALLFIILVISSVIFLVNESLSSDQFVQITEQVIKKIPSFGKWIK